MTCGEAPTESRHTLRKTLVHFLLPSQARSHLIKSAPHLRPFPALLELNIMPLPTSFPSSVMPFLRLSLPSASRTAPLSPLRSHLQHLEIRSLFLTGRPLPSSRWPLSITLYLPPLPLQAQPTTVVYLRLLYQSAMNLILRLWILANGSTSRDLRRLKFRLPQPIIL